MPRQYFCARLISNFWNEREARFLKTSKPRHQSCCLLDHKAKLEDSASKNAKCKNFARGGVDFRA